MVIVIVNMLMRIGVLWLTAPPLKKKKEKEYITKISSRQTSVSSLSYRNKFVALVLNNIYTVHQNRYQSFSAMLTLLDFLIFLNIFCSGLLFIEKVW